MLQARCGYGPALIIHNNNSRFKGAKQSWKNRRKMFENHCLEWKCWTTFSSTTSSLRIKPWKATDSINSRFCSVEFAARARADSGDNITGACDRVCAYLLFPEVAYVFGVLCAVVRGLLQQCIPLIRLIFLLHSGFSFFPSGVWRFACDYKRTSRSPYVE